MVGNQRLIWRTPRASSWGPEWKITSHRTYNSNDWSETLASLGPSKHTAISRKVVAKNVHVTIPKDNMGYDQYTVPNDCSCQTYFCCFPVGLADTFSWPFVQILSNFFEKKRTQNHPQCLSGLSPTLSPTTFLEITINRKIDYIRALWFELVWTCTV